MNSFRPTIEAWRQQGLQIAVATVIKVKGSAYRREGAKMVIAENGQSEGTVSGGCLESDLIEHAKKLFADGKPSRHFYDMTADADLVWGLGIGCNGKIDVLLEPLPSDTVHLFRERKEPLARVVLVGLEGQMPSRIHDAYVRRDGTMEGTLGYPQLDELVRSRAAELLQRGRSATLEFSWSDDAGYERQSEVYIESQWPELDFVIYGAGHDAIPLVPLAKKMGFRVHVVDSRPQFAVSERFPEADQVIHAHPDELEGKVPVGAFVYSIIMTHRFLDDAKILSWLARKESAYIGVLGPRERLEEMIDEVKRLGVTLSLEQLPQIYNPVGLDIGGDTPEQVAVSIIAEVVAVKNNRRGGHLKDRRGPIHERFTDTK